MSRLSRASLPGRLIKQWQVIRGGPEHRGKWRDTAFGLICHQTREREFDRRRPSPKIRTAELKEEDPGYLLFGGGGTGQEPTLLGVVRDFVLHGQELFQTQVLGGIEHFDTNDLLVIPEIEHQVFVDAMIDHLLLAVVEAKVKQVAPGIVNDAHLRSPILRRKRTP